MQGCCDRYAAGCGIQLSGVITSLLSFAIFRGSEYSLAKKDSLYGMSQNQDFHKKRPHIPDMGYARNQRLNIGAF
jgi:hypothetical protein